MLGISLPNCARECAKNLSASGCPNMAILAGTSGIITSPSYPGNYGNNHNCTWKIMASTGNRVNLVIQDMEIEEGTNCPYDYIQIQSAGIYGSGVLPGRLCGSVTRDWTFSSYHETLIVRFVTDGSLTGRGFKARYTTVIPGLPGYFMYIEASSLREREDNAKLYSPPLTFAGHMCLEFYYRMSDAAIGSLKVTIDEKVVFSRSGHRGDNWYKASINVSAIVGLQRVTFEGVVGNRFSGYIAIDDFSLTAGSCAYDCSQKFHHFEKQQDLPTRGGSDVEHFTIDGTRFLAFANYRSDTEGYITDSFIYKQNDSTGIFFLYQTLGTHGGIDMEYFKIGDQHYLAVANHRTEPSYRQNSVIYQWRQEQFVVFQSIETFGAASFDFFEIKNEQFLAISNYNDDSSYSINSFIYKWNSNKFEKIQDIATEGALNTETFVISNETFIAFANHGQWHMSPQNQDSVQSAVFKWSGQQFVKLQSFQTYGALDVKLFSDNGSTFLAFVNYRHVVQRHINSPIYKWNGSNFVLFQSIPTPGAAALHPFTMCSQTFLGVANHYDDDNGYITMSVVYRVSQEQFIEYQEIPTQGAFGMTSFQYKGYTYLAVANFKTNKKHNINSALYKWA